MVVRVLLLNLFHLTVVHLQHFECTLNGTQVGEEISLAPFLGRAVIVLAEQDFHFDLLFAVSNTLFSKEASMLIVGLEL